MATKGRKASAGHKLGQLIGDWFEEYFVFPLLKDIARTLNLFLDSRFIHRRARGEKIQWKDAENNYVDYDFVMEIEGNNLELGIPVAFIESFWRRGARHSKDKARDDSGKLLPMLDTYPSARFLGIIAAGDFTLPARELVKSRGIELFYVPKEKLIRAFEINDLVIDYPDRSPEPLKNKILKDFEKKFTKSKKIKIRNELKRLIGSTTISAFTHSVKAKLSAFPQEIRFILRQDSKPIIFESVIEANNFLKHPEFKMINPKESYVYQIIFSDGSEFERSVSNISELKELHETITKLSIHMEKLKEKRKI